MKSCAGLRAVITGGSRGIGLAIARELVESGADVSICARGESGLAAAVDSLETEGATLYSEALDVSEATALARWVRNSADALGGIDIAIHNASALMGEGDAAWEANFSVDLMGASRLVDAALPFLEQSSAASVIFISSTAGLEHFVGAPAYSAIKAGLIVHANDLAHTLAEKGIRVNTVSPGAIFFEQGFWDHARDQFPDLYEAVVERTALGRLGSPDEVARCVRFLASSDASYVTGANLVVDGGLTFGV